MNKLFHFIGNTIWTAFQFTLAVGMTVFVLSVIPIIVIALDLLHKSVFETEFKIMNSSDDVETKRETLSSIAISFTENTKYLQAANNILDQDAFTR